MTTAGMFTEYPLYPTYGLAGYPEYITTGPDGALWFTYDGYSGYPSGVVRITTVGSVTVYGVALGLQEITTGSDGALWSADEGGNIWRVTTAGVATKYPVPLRPSGGGTGPIAAGPDGALWFTVSCNPCSTSWIGRVTPSGLVTEYALGSGSWLFGAIGAGPDGGIWFTTSHVRPASTYIARAPACGLGLSAGYDGAAIATTFDLATSRPALWNISIQSTTELRKPTLPVSLPRFITLNWNASGFTGNVLVKSELADFTGQVMCAEWTTVSTGR